MDVWIFFLLYPTVRVAIWLLALLWKSLQRSRTRTKRLQNWQPPQ